MTDAVDEARAALELELYKYLPTDTCAQDRKDIRSAADRYALAVLDEAIPEGGVIWLQKRKALIRVRLEGSHAD